MRNLSKINEGADVVTKDYVDGNIPTKTSDLTNDSGFITTDEKIKLTSVTNDSEYPVLLGPTSITSGSTYSGDYNTNITINPNSKQLTLKSIKLYYNDNCSATLATKGYVGNSKNHIPIVNFASTAANTSGTLDYYTYLSGVETPTSNESNYDTFVANKKYVDDKFGSIIVPTKTSDLTNDSGFVTTDEKVKATAYTEDGTQKYLIFGENSGSAETKYYDAGLQYAANNTITTPKASLILGNTSLLGQVLFYKGNGDSVYTTLRSSSSGADNTVTLPNATGTIALTSDIPTVPTNVSAFTNDAGYLTSYIETDPTVPSWAKASTKPTYTASEVGALASNTTYVSTITTTAGAHSAISSKSGAVSFNVPTKTSHLTNDSGFLTSHQTLYEANLNWGGKDFSASYSPIDAAMIDVLGANRFAFLKAAGLTIEYSTNGGSSYTDYGATDAQKVGLFSSGQSFYLGKHTSNGSCTTNDRLRVTIDTGAAGIYTVLNKIAIYMSTSGATVQVLIEKALQNTPTTFSTHKDWTGISGWSGWNILNISGLTTYGNTATSQYGRIRFTFRQTAVNTNYSSANISKIMAFGGVGWTVPSTMAATGHLYSYDSSQNATFPAKVTANEGFSGNLTGNVTGNVSGSAGSVAWSGVTSKPTATGSKVTGITASTTATKTTLGTAFTIPNVTSVGSASTWAFEDIACDDITSWSAGSGSASISGAVDSSDSSQLNITISHTHTAPNLQYTARTVSSKKSGANGSAPTLGTAFTVPNVTDNTSATVSVTDPGHTHSI